MPRSLVALALAILALVPVHAEEWLEGCVETAVTARPIAGATVWLAPEQAFGEAEILAATTTVASGAFHLPRPAVGGYFHLTVEASGFNRESVSWNPGQERPPVLRLMPTSTVSGRIINASSGAPVVGASARLEPLRDSLPTWAATTNASGEFRMDSVAAGWFELHAETERLFLPTEEPSIVRVPPASEVVLPAVALVPGTTLVFDLTSSDPAHPIPAEAWARVVRTKTEDWEERIVSDAFRAIPHGRGVWTDLPPYPCQLQLSAAGFYTSYWSVSPSPGGVTSITPEIAPAPHVSGLVLDISGNAVPRAEVYFSDEGWDEKRADGSPAPCTVSSCTGYYRLSLEGDPRDRDLVAAVPVLATASHRWREGRPRSDIAVDLTVYQGGVIFGKAVDASGEPFREGGVRLSAFVDEEICHWVQRPGPNGSYRFEGLPTDGYRLQLVSEHFGSRRYDDLWLKDGDVIGIPDLVAAPWRRLEGRVLEAGTSHPLVGVGLIIQQNARPQPASSTDERLFPWRVTTDANGRFRFTGLASEHASLELELPKSLRARYEYETSFNHSCDLSDGDVLDCTIELRPAPSRTPVRGIVIDALSGRPLRDVQPALQFRAGDGRWVFMQPVHVEESNEEGRFALWLAPRKNVYRIHIAQSMFADWSSEGFDGDALDDLPEIEAVLFPQGRINGRVVDVDGHEVTRGLVQLRRRDAPDGAERRDINEEIYDGWFSAYPLPPGEYRLLASVRPVDWDEKVDPRYVREVRLATGERLEGVRLTLMPGDEEPVYLSGRVLNHAGRAMPDTLISVGALDGTKENRGFLGYKSTLAGPDGWFRIGPLPAGRYEVTVHSPNLFSICTWPAAVPCKDLELRLPEMGSIHGRVIWATGEPLSEFYLEVGVEIDHLGSKVTMRSRVQDMPLVRKDGHFKLDRLFPGRYRLVAWGTRDGRGSEDIELAPGEHVRGVEIICHPDEP